MKTLLELEPNDCRYPFGEENFQFCAEAKYVYLHEGKMCISPYCKNHHLIAFRPFIEKKVRAA